MLFLEKMASWFSNHLGTVNLSGRAWQTLHGQARGRSLGIVDLKGKEPLEVIRCDELT